ncbi:EG45-like domain containing protein [Carex littledalei]|uniref:EG45-like domain containing protein n=1 Tax=Carex littledalei TaxID=544730 RepID=A0A833VSN7_9POAL|nr:EG45-like domain containing protein [Carex littledalei]
MRFMALLAIISLLVLSKEIILVRGDLATAASYGPPYTPTQCNGNSQDQFPPNSMFAAVSTVLWDNGAACGRNYIVKCLSGTGDRPCKQGNIVVQVVDKCPQDPCRATLLLSKDAFNALSRSPTAKLNIEYAHWRSVHTRSGLVRGHSILCELDYIVKSEHYP